MSDIFDEALASVPKFIMNCPISYHWVDYNGKRKFAMLNFEESLNRGKAMIDLCYCATAGMINHRVEKTVPYSRKRFKICADQ
jgi:hypothetical protein